MGPRVGRLARRVGRALEHDPLHEEVPDGASGAVSFPGPKLAGFDGHQAHFVGHFAGSASWGRIVHEIRSLVVLGPISHEGHVVAADPLILAIGLIVFVPADVHDDVRLPQHTRAKPLHLGELAAGKLAPATPPFPLAAGGVAISWPGMRFRQRGNMGAFD